jgi:hypothetical protein
MSLPFKLTALILTCIFPLSHVRNQRILFL